MPRSASPSHLVIDQHTHDRLRYAQQLLGHQIPGEDVAQVLGRALEALIGQLERRKCAATPRPRPGRHDSSAHPRSIPAAVRRAVWERDGGRCSFVSPAGHRCPARTPLEYDHRVPVARGGRSTVDNLRLRCRPHNEECSNEECSSRAWRGSDELKQATTSERHAGKNVLN